MGNVYTHYPLNLTKSYLCVSVCNYCSFIRWSRMIEKLLKQLKNPGIRLMIERIRSEEKQVKRVFVITVFGSILGAFVHLVYGKIIRMAGDNISSVEYILLFVLMWLTVDQIRNWTTRYSD